MPDLIHELLLESAERTPRRDALAYADLRLDYEALAHGVGKCSSTLIELGVLRSARVGIFMEKRLEAVIAAFGAAAAGAVFVPINPALKPDQVAYILRDCNVNVFVTTAERLELVEPVLSGCPDVRAVLCVGGQVRKAGTLPVFPWHEALSHAVDLRPHRVIDADMAAILYTSGSTGRPKGVVLSHKNIVAGAKSVASYLDLQPEDRLLAALPLSFDAGFSQLTTAFASHASVVLLNYLMPRDVLDAVERHKITGLTAVPPLWIQLAELAWPEGIQITLRFIANTGGRMPKATLDALRAKLPRSLVYLMYGLTESFRSTYLSPSELDRRPDSIGKAIPNAEVLVVREDGSPCAPNEPGELVHRGALVSLGYWNDPEKTAERFKPAPGQPVGLVMPEIAVWSGDTVQRDEEGFLYFIGRRDEMIKTSGYRVSPTEVEEILYATGKVGEVAAVGVPHPVLGQAIIVVATAPAHGYLDQSAIIAECRQRLPTFMIPARVVEHKGSLPRNPNGKIDRKLLAQQLEHSFEPLS
jgi:acyl-CoA ligase (AMP-forming) (exosortase A-associated)